MGDIPVHKLPFDPQYHELFVKCIHVPSVVVLRSFSGYLNVECVLHVTKERASD